MTSLQLGSVQCIMIFLCFFFSFLLPFFPHFLPIGEQIEMQEIEHNEIPEVEAPESPFLQPGQYSIRILIFTETSFRN